MRAHVARGYGWMQENPATVALVSLAIGVVASFAVFLLFLQVEDTRRALNPRTEPLENPCVSHQRVEGTRGRNCPRFFVPRRRNRRTEKRKEVVHQNPSPAGQRTAPPSSGGAPGKAPRRSTPRRTTPPPASPAPRSTSPAPVVPTPILPPQASPKADPPGKQTPVRDAVQGVSESANEAVCSLPVQACK